MKGKGIILKERHGINFTREARKPIPMIKRKDEQKIYKGGKQHWCTQTTKFVMQFYHSRTLGILARR